MLPKQGKKRIGRKTLPTSDLMFTNKRAAVVLSDSILFHGVQLTVDVQNAYRSRLIGMNVTIAPDRLVRFEEGGIECTSDKHVIRLRVRPREHGSGVPYSAFPSELPRKFLKRFPILLEYDKQNRFVGLAIFNPMPAKRKRLSPTRRTQKIDQAV